MHSRVENFIFYHDETNNVRKLHFSSGNLNTEEKVYVLGGILIDKNKHDIFMNESLPTLKQELNLQPNIKELKFKHIAPNRKNFIEVLGNKNINIFLHWFYRLNGVYIHYIACDFIYWSIVDIIESCGFQVLEEDLLLKYELKSYSSFATAYYNTYSDIFKDILYCVVKENIGKTIDIFTVYSYPNIKSSEIHEFIQQFINLTRNSSVTPTEKNILITALMHVQKQDELIFIQNEKNCILLENFMPFYWNRLSQLKNATHIFDKELEIESKILDIKMHSELLNESNYSFCDSRNNECIQVSDLFIGLLGKFLDYVAETESGQIFNDLNSLSGIHLKSFHLLAMILEKNDNFYQELSVNVMARSTYAKKCDILCKVKRKYENDTYLRLVECL